MKQRIAFFHDGNDSFDPEKQLAVSPQSVTITSLPAARQEKLTFTFDELPAELQDILKRCRALHVRWATERPFHAIGPFASRVSPGLHVLYSPRLDIPPDDPSRLLCESMRKTFGVDAQCGTAQSLFTSRAPVSGLSSMTAAKGAKFQSYALLSSLEHFIKHASTGICEHSDSICALLETLRSVDSLDFDYDAVSSSFSVTGFWFPKDPWSETITKPAISNLHRTEIGIFSLQDWGGHVTKLSLGGLVAVVGKDTEKMKPTLLSIPAQHQPLPSSDSFTVDFQHPASLHPQMHIAVPRAALKGPPRHAQGECRLHTYLTLPSNIFADKYQLDTSDHLFLKEHKIRSLQAISGETDLEAPDWVLDAWGSSVLVELDPLVEANPQQTDDDKNQSNGNGKNQGRDGDGDDQLRVSIPLHLRYLHPSPSGYRNISIPYPVVFWACHPHSPGDNNKKPVKWSDNPFHRHAIGYDDIFSSDTIFYHLHPSPVPKAGAGADADAGLINTLQVPVLKLDGDGVLTSDTGIERITTCTILAGFIFVAYTLYRMAMRYGVGADTRGAGEEQAQQWREEKDKPKDE